MTNKEQKIWTAMMREAFKQALLSLKFEAFDQHPTNTQVVMKQPTFYVASERED